MGKTNYASVILLCVFGSLGCASGHCRGKAPETAVFVYKEDGSLQCGKGKAVSVTEMQKELGSIVVLNAENRPDGLMHAQVCGAPTGRINVYKIPAQNKEQALKLGFKEYAP